jgi:hypothetical protein
VFRPVSLRLDARCASWPSASASFWRTKGKMAADERRFTPIKSGTMKRGWSRRRFFDFMLHRVAFVASGLGVNRFRLRFELSKNRGGAGRSLAASAASLLGQLDISLPDIRIACDSAGTGEAAGLKRLISVD